MPKNYYLESYQKNSKKFMNFLNKEIPEDYETQKRKLREYEILSGYTGFTFSQQEQHAKKKETLKVNACELRDDVKEYDKFMSGLSEKKDISLDDVKKLKKKNSDIVYGLKHLCGDGSWKTNNISRTAVAKYNRILLENDAKKMQYFSKLSEKGINKEVSLKEILDAPTPVTEVANIGYSVFKLREYTEKMLKNMEKTESILHKNSKEYNAMKAALKDLHDISRDNENKRDIDSFGIGSKIEALQTVAMKYAETKGVGEQYSKRGQARMYAALDMCAEMSDFMSKFASKERMKEIQEFEKGLTEKTINKEEKNEMNKEQEELDSFER